MRHFIAEAAVGGVDVFRIFDCFNWVDNMRVAIDAVVASGKVAEGALCYTGDILDPARSKYSLDYYVDLAGRLEEAGCHMLAIKDMAGLLKPAAASVLVKAIRSATSLPLRLHTHDTSGAAAATLLSAIDAGVDAVDAAIDAMSGTTSQPCLGAIVEALRHTPRDSGIDPVAVRRLSSYWEAVRAHYAAFESDQRSGASEVYLHEMPGGQFTNLKEQARSLGLADRWPDIAAAYHDANLLFGDIVKVTPSSKVVGDMALAMVSQGIGADDILDIDRDISFPASVVEMLRGDLGQPVGGWPAAIQQRVLKGEPAITERPAALLPPIDLAAARAEADALSGRPISDAEFASYLMYPKVFVAFAKSARDYGPVSVLGTPTFFFGMEVGEEIAVDIEPGKTLIICLQAIGETEEDGRARLFFELNGQPRMIAIADRRVAGSGGGSVVADPADPRHLGAPMPGLVTGIAVKAGQTIATGDLLLTLEAMKMETSVAARRDGTVAEIMVKPGQSVEAKHLLMLID